MPAMPMPSEFKTKPGKEPGEYVCLAYFGMEGEWKLIIKVQQMEGTTMDGDGQVDFTINADLMTKAVVPPPRPAPPPGHQQQIITCISPEGSYYC